MEIWKDIKGFEGLYKISSMGRIKSLSRVVNRGTNYLTIQERILKPCVHNGYAHVMLSKNGVVSTGRIHRLVAEAFIPNPSDLPCINHKDENKQNNNVDNLEWCSYSYNNSYNLLRIKAAINKRKAILQFDKNGNFIKRWEHAGEAADKLGINKRGIYECCKGRSKTSGGYVWKRVEDMI